MKVIKIVLRWVLCFPAGIILGVLALFLYDSIGREQPNLFIAILGGAFSGAATIYVCCLVAPNYEGQLAVILAALLILCNGLGIYYAFQSQELNLCILYFSQIIGGVFNAREIYLGKVDVRWLF